MDSVYTSRTVAETNNSQDQFSQTEVYYHIHMKINNNNLTTFFLLVN